MRRVMWGWLALVGLSATGCFSPHFADGKTRCSTPSRQCPSGFHCAFDDHCWSNGHDPDDLGMAGDLAAADGGAGDAGADLATPDLAYRDFSVNFDFAGVDLYVGPHITVAVAGGHGYVGNPMSIVATLSGLVLSDTGNATLTTDSGLVLSPVSCGRTDVAVSTCTGLFTPSAAGNFTITAQSRDDGSTGIETFPVFAPPSISVDKVSFHLLALGSPPQTDDVLATVSNLAPGDSPNVTFTVASGDSVQILSGATGGTAAVFAPTTKYNFPAPSTPPLALIQAASVADPQIVKTITITVHAFVDESSLLTPLVPIADQLQLWTATIDPNTGAAIVGGVRRQNLTPTALLRQADGTWVTALSAYKGAAGAITSSALGLAGGFVLAGVTGPADSNGNRSLLVVGCPAANPYCNGDPTNLTDQTPDVAHAAALDAETPWSNTSAKVPVTASPIIVTHVANAHLDAELAYITPGGSSCINTGATKALGKLKASVNLGIADLTDVALADELSPAVEPNTSCPFSTTAKDRLYTGMAVNSSNGQLWVSGTVDCGYGTTGSCSNATAMNYGLIRQPFPLSATGWRTYYADMSQAAAANLKRGYDDTLIVIGTYSANFGALSPFNGASLLWYYATGTPAAYSGGAILRPGGGSGTNEGMVAGGAGSGGSSWAGVQPDLFFSTRQTVSGAVSYWFGWELGSTMQSVVQTAANINDGVQVLDLAFARTSSLYVDGLAVGQRITGGVVSPFVARLH